MAPTGPNRLFAGENGKPIRGTQVAKANFKIADP